MLINTILRGRKLYSEVSAVKKVISKEVSMASDNKLEDAINKVTAETLNKSVFAMDAAYKDCKIPLAENNEYILTDIDRYISSKINIIKTEATGKKPTSYKIKGKKSFALLIDLGNGRFKLTVKCGPAYGVKLLEYFKNIVEQSKFPYGVIWFTVSNEVKQPSLELIKQMIDISYEIAKIGY
ncbi:MAG: MmcQ/YjbR family DNA-binding protein [Erysipelotrichales bacterium]|nr:MmcQ/YjbR family DNA-binding protein [Erysipelotrichales bacterium]